MLDKYLPQYLLDVTTLTAPDGTTRTSVISTATNGNVFRNDAPQGTPFPYVVVGQAYDIDFGQTADRDLLREIGCFSVVVCGRKYKDIDQIYRDVVDAIKAVRNQYIPSAIAAARIWTQCIIIKNSEQFTSRPIDGDQQLMLGYNLTVKAGYDP